MKVVVAFSGGMDSTVLLTSLLTNEAVEEVMAVTFHYGALHNDAEKEAARSVLKYFQDKEKTVPWINEQVPENWYAGVSALTGDIEMPETSYEEIDKTRGPSPTVIPFRNAFLISRCTTNAIKYGYDYVAVATHASDYDQWAYPDCSPEFLGAMANAVYIGSYNDVRLHFPFVYLTKGELVARGALLNAPLHLTYSCYKGYPHYHCGVCPTCVERQKAFISAGYKDPVIYEIYPALLKLGATWPTSTNF